MSTNQKQNVSLGLAKSEYAIIAILLVLVVIYLRFAGRSWLGPDGNLFLWYGDANGPGTSQHLLDPYSFTHFLHGVAFCGLIALVARNLSSKWQLFAAVALESLWEIVENSETVINRYRETTMALGYFGDSIANSLSDIFVCAVGFCVASQIGFKKSLLLFIAVEIFLILWIKDSLCINVIMLLYPLDAIKAWQIG